jgi:hypothetical protein
MNSKKPYCNGFKNSKIVEKRNVLLRQYPGKGVGWRGMSFPGKWISVETFSNSISPTCFT